MSKISFLLNALFALILLGVIIAMLFFGYRFISDTSNYNVTSSESELSEDSTNTSAISPVEPISNQLVNSDVIKVASVIELIPEAESEPVPKPEPKKQFISLYPATSDELDAFTTLEKDIGIVVYHAGPEWTEILSSKGMPVWIRGDLVKNIGSGYVEVFIPRVNARSAPNTESSVVIGSLVKGEVLKVNRKQDGWIRAWSPVRFRAWVKTKDL